MSGLRIGYSRNEKITKIINAKIGVDNADLRI